MNIEQILNPDLTLEEASKQLKKYGKRKSPGQIHELFRRHSPQRYGARLMQTADKVRRFWVVPSSALPVIAKAL